MGFRILLALLLPFLCIFIGATTTLDAKFAYQPGSCEIAITNLVREIVQSELHAALNPKFRYSKEKLLRFDLYTNENPDKRQILHTGDVAALRKSNFNPKWPVRFSIHGWMGNALTCSNAALKDAYLTRGNFNVIIVDWSAHAVDVSYVRISTQLSAMARHLVKFIDFLHRQTGVAYEQIYLIGHSAGAHISGWAGKMLRPQRLGAIIALDPAGLAQLSLSAAHRLAPTDALYVEAIHTDISVLGNPNTNLSQAAFFPNWGIGQPHCPNATAAEFDFVCDHFSSLYYFAESIRNEKLFGALRCKTGHLNQHQGRNDIDLSFDKVTCACDPPFSKSCVADAFFGGEPLVPKRGVFYFSTSKVSPFGYGQIVRINSPQPSNFLRSGKRRGNAITKF